MFAPTDELLTPAQLAERLHVTVAWVWEHTRNRASIRDAEPLPHLKLSRKALRFVWRDVAAWLDRLSKQ
jgi:alkanesulfonate monooxygenase SsuD/methylene tetrahydromethanopterin reductase-like flavin-dependent oxidoreductase (luciferase family)